MCFGFHLRPVDQSRIQAQQRGLLRSTRFCLQVASSIAGSMGKLELSVLTGERGFQSSIPSSCWTKEGILGGREGNLPTMISEDRSWLAHPPSPGDPSFSGSASQDSEIQASPSITLYKQPQKCNPTSSPQPTVSTVPFRA